MNNNANNFLLKDIKEDEEIVIIDMLDCEESYSKIKYKIDIARKEEPKRIYIILENERKGKISALFIDDFQWNININEIAREDKEKFVINFLEKNNIEVYKEWISEISVKPYYEIKNICLYCISDIFSRTIRPIKHDDNSKEMYDKKVNSWQERFDNLNIIKW